VIKFHSLANSEDEECKFTCSSILSRHEHKLYLHNINNLTGMALFIRDHKVALTMYSYCITTAKWLYEPHRAIVG
jgi:hypothetical protein